METKTSIRTLRPVFAHSDVNMSKTVEPVEQHTQTRLGRLSNNGALVSNFIIPVFKQVVCSTVGMSDNNLLMNNAFVRSLVCIFLAATTGKHWICLHQKL